MSRTVRRLVFDYQPLWLLMDVVLFGMMTFMDWGWLFHIRGPAVVQWFVPVFSVFCGILFVQKMPAWQVLPVPPAQRRRALWWLWIGLPLIRATLCMVLPTVVIGALHGVHATPAQIAGVLEAQLLAILPMGAIFSANGLLRRRFGLGAQGFLMVFVFAVGVPFSNVQLTTPVQLGCGAVLLAILAPASYVWTDRIAAAIRFSDQIETRPASAARGRARGWAALAPHALGAIVVAVAAAVAVNYSIVAMLGPNMVDHSRRVLPSQMIMTVILLTAIGGQVAPYALRALRALPLGPAALTAVLQGFILAIAVVPIGVLWVMMRATNLDTSQVPVYVAGMVPVVALRLPVNFRVGIQAGMFIAVVPVVGLMFLPFAGPMTHSPWFDAAMLLVAAGIWVWTWWEMACGRAAYRVQPMGVMRWRGGLN